MAEIAAKTRNWSILHRAVSHLQPLYECGKDGDTETVACRLCGYVVVLYTGERGWAATVLKNIARHAEGHLAGR